MGNGILFVKRERSDCCYRIPFGSESICTCPIRKERYPPATGAVPRRYRHPGAG